MGILLHLRPLQVKERFDRTAAFQVLQYQETSARNMPSSKKPSHESERPPLLSISHEGDATVLHLSGALEPGSCGELWRQVMALLPTQGSRALIIEASGLVSCGAAGLALLIELQRRQQQAGSTLEIRHLRPELGRLLDLFDPAAFPKGVEPPSRSDRLPEEIGKLAWGLWLDVRELIIFTGELSVELLKVLHRPWRLRWSQVWITAEKVGSNALPIVLLVSFLVGLIMAFQAAVAMRPFGAEIYVANLVAVSMLRELGPLMTAIVLAGRSGSAFAAELGTMKINEEIDALVTFGLEPVRFLAVTRVLATMATLPLLVVFANLAGIIGGALVMLSLGYPPAAYLNQVLGAVTYLDLLGGLFKSLFFALIVAGIGCLRGLQTATGPGAVGDSATRAVVSGIVLIVASDGFFSYLFFALGI
jgi:phospholipid/cholesterol/gamma-HCH transport system permease protein